MRKFIIAAAMSALALSSANAADHNDAVENDVFGWGGFYVGVQAGYGKGQTDFTETALNTGLGAVADVDPKGGFVGLLAGYNWQDGNMVYGIEGDYNLSRIEDTQILSPINAIGHEVESFGSIRARLGYAMDRTLLFATAGLAIANVETFQNFAAAPETDSDTTTGFTVGAGIEHAFTDAWTARLEYRYYNFGDSSHFAVSPAGYTPRDIDLDMHTISFGLAYKF